MNGLSCVKTDYRNNYNDSKNLIVYGHNMKNTTMFSASYEEPYTPNTEKTVLTAGLLQAFALFLHKASEWCGTKLMQGKEFTTAENVHKTAENMVSKNKLNVTVDFIDADNIKNYPTALQEALKPVARGENAFYTDQFKLAVAPKKKPSLILYNSLKKNATPFFNFFKISSKIKNVCVSCPDCNCNA